MLQLSAWAQGIVTFSPDASHLVGLDWPYLVHLVLGMLYESFIHVPVSFEDCLYRLVMILYRELSEDYSQYVLSDITRQP